MEEAEAKQSGSLHDKVEFSLVDPDSWSFTTANSITMTSYDVEKEEHNKALTRIKELEADAVRPYSWDYKRVKELEAEKEDILVLHNEALKSINELEADKEFLERANCANWTRLIKANVKIRDLEAETKWLVETLRGYMPSTKISDDSGNFVEVKYWGEEYGWTQHIFDPLDSNPLLGCKKWLP